jgi:hypothetical protein
MHKPKMTVKVISRNGLSRLDNDGLDGVEFAKPVSVPVKSTAEDASVLGGK